MRFEVLHVYEVCPKSNGTGVTNNLFQFQTTNYMFFPFKVIPLESHALFHPSLQCWKDSSGMSLSSIITALLMASMHSKRVPLIIPMSLRKIKKSHAEQDQVNREFFPIWQCSSRPGTAGCSGHCQQVLCRGEAVGICPATTLVSSRALSEAKAAGSLCRLAGWSSGPVARTYCGRCLWHRRTWSTWLWLLILTLAFFGTVQWQLWRLVFWIILKNPCLITSDDSTKQVWFSLKTLSDVLTHLHAALLLIIIQQPWHQFCADFPHERRCKQKHVKQNSMVAESYDYSFILPRYHVRW